MKHETKLKIWGFNVEVNLDTGFDKVKNKNRLEVVLDNHLKGRVLSERMPQGVLVSNKATSVTFMDANTQMNDYIHLVANILTTIGFPLRDGNFVWTDLVRELYWGLVPFEMRTGCCHYCGAISRRVERDTATPFCPECADAHARHWHRINNEEAARREAALCPKCKRAERIGGLCFLCEDEEEAKQAAGS